MNFRTERHGDLFRALAASGREAWIGRRRARRVQGDSVSGRPAVRLACGSADGHSWRRLAPIGLGIVPGGDETSALLSVSPASVGGRARQILDAHDGASRAVYFSPRTVFGRRSPSFVRGGSISKADHEARGSSEIVSKGRPQAVYNANRIARANKLGAAPLDARRRTCDAASSACNTWYWSVAKPRREIRKSLRSWEVLQHLSTDSKSAAVMPRLLRSVGSPCAVHRPFAEGGGKYRPSYFMASRVWMAANRKQKEK